MASGAPARKENGFGRAIQVLSQTGLQPWACAKKRPSVAEAAKYGVPSGTAESRALTGFACESWI